MRFSPTIIALCFCLTAGAANPSTNDQGAVDRAANAITQGLHDALADLPEDACLTDVAIAEIVDEALLNIDPRTLSAQEIRLLDQGGVLRHSGRLPEFLQRLEELAADESADGALALSRIAWIQFPRPEIFDMDDRVTMLRRIIHHPGLHDSLRRGDDVGVFGLVLWLDEAGVQRLFPDMPTLERVLTPDLPPRTAYESHFLLEAVTEVSGLEHEEIRLRIRDRVLAVIDGAMARADGAAAVRLERARAYAAGSAVEGRLVGSPAPDLEFIWSSVEPAPALLSDFRGRVVVLVFGMSHDVRSTLNEIADRFDPGEVAVVNVMGPFHPERWAPPAGDPRESDDQIDAILAFIDEHNVRWPIFFTPHGVHDPHFGVQTWPRIFVIDAEGIVLTSGHKQSASLLDDLVEVVESAKRGGGPVRRD